MLPSATDILDKLYPTAEARGALQNGSVRRRGRVRRVALPNLRNARVVLPADARLAGRSFRRMRHSDSITDNVMSSLAAGALTMGISKAAPSHMAVSLDPETWNVEDEIGKLLDRPIRTSIFLGPPRANRKPVLQVYDDAGELVAVAKIGINDLTTRLARAEAAALRVLARSTWTQVVVPVLLAEHEWNGMTMVVQSPLRIWERTSSPSVSQRSAAFSEIAQSQGVVRSSIVDSPYVRELKRRVARLNDDELRGRTLKCLSVLESHTDRRIDHGSWHGDLTRWNMALTDDGALVWDWERFEQGVPVGYDALHHDFLPSLKAAGVSHDDVGTRLLARAPALLEPLGMNHESADLVAVLYLIELAVRFTVDEQAATGVVGGDARSWLLPALHSLSRVTEGSI